MINPVVDTVIIVAYFVGCIYLLSRPWMPALQKLWVIWEGSWLIDLFKKIFKRNKK